MRTEPEAPAPAAEPDSAGSPALVALPRRDVRRKRPPAFSFLLRLETLRRGARIISLLLSDYVALFLAIFTALGVKTGLQGSFVFRDVLDQTQSYIGFAYLVTVLLFARSDLYAERARRPGLPRIVTALFQATVVMVIFALADGQKFQSYYVFYGSLFFATVYVGFLRWLHAQVTGALLERAGFRRRALVVGGGRHAEFVGRALEDAPRLPVEVVGCVSPDGRPQGGLRAVGRLDDIHAVLADEGIQDVVIADPEFPQQRAVELADYCHQRGVAVHVAPTTMEILLQRAEFVPGQSLPLFTLKPPVFEGLDFALKRAFDLVGATLLVVVLSPLLLACALAIRLTSRGPVLYRSKRPGMGGEPFSCLKFRTMRTDADERQADLEELNEADGALFKIREDPRVTRVGGVLRRYSIDELPQLINVLRGDMSLVGPRPLPTRDFERLDDWHKKRYLVLPGITGLWQVSGRSELDFDDLVRLDFLYLERWSIALDLVILLKTVPAVIRRRGAF
ncbi:MAG: sugar transferase [Solirubrobacteraceae bacterium]